MKSHTFQEWGQLGERCVGHVVEPTFDKDAVVRLELEIFGHVVDNDGPGEVSTDTAKVLHKDRAIWQGMLSVHSVADMLILINLIKNPVGILVKCKNYKRRETYILHGCSENHYLIDLTHFPKEDIAARPHKEVSFLSDLKIVNKSFI